MGYCHAEAQGSATAGGDKTKDKDKKKDRDTTGNAGGRRHGHPCQWLAAKQGKRQGQSQRRRRRERERERQRCPPTCPRTRPSAPSGPALRRPATDATNCGACGNVCPITTAPGASASPAMSRPATRLSCLSTAGTASIRRRTPRLWRLRRGLRHRRGVPERRLRAHGGRRTGRGHLQRLLRQPQHQRHQLRRLRGDLRHRRNLPRWHLHFSCTLGTACREVCVDTTSDSRNCGGCGLACPSDRVLARTAPAPALATPAARSREARGAGACAEGLTGSAAEPAST